MLEFAENDILILRKVLPEDLQQCAEYRREFLDHGDSMDGCSNLRRFDNMADWYDWICKAEHPDTCPSNWMPDTQFICLRKKDGRLVGMLDIRHELNDVGRKLFGNIGYSIRKSERRKGYATMQLALAKTICRSMGMDRILITCHKENCASAKTIRNNGGNMENAVTDERNGAVLQRYWIDLT